MKDLLTFGIDFLLIMLIINLAVNGMVIGDIEILSIKQIQEKNAKVTEAIENSNRVQDAYYSSLSQLDAAEKSTKTSEEIFTNTLSASSNEVKKLVSEQKLFDIEYIWGEVGRLATHEGLALKITVEPTGVDSINTLRFKVMGQYKGIKEFMTNLDRNNDLDFRVEEFNLFIYEQKPVTVQTEAGMSKYLLQTIGATFTVNNVAIKKEEVSKEFTGTTYEIEAGSEYQGFVKALDDNTVNGNVTNATNTAANSNTATNTNSTANSNSTANTNSTNEIKTEKPN